MKTYKMKISIILAIVFIAGCETTPLEPIVLGKKFDLEYGQQIIVQDEDIRIQFDDVLNDSRCPKEVVCVWAGNAKIAIRFNDAEIKLNTNLEPEQVIIFDYKIELISVNPYPIYDTDTEKKDYVATLLVTKK